MGAFTYPPLTPDPDPAPLSPTIPLNPPMVGDASPFIHVDGQNRDLILESIRAWIRTSLLEWTKDWQEYLVYWLALTADWLNTWATEADGYITTHAISGLSWRTTVTPIANSGTTDVVLVVDTDHRPIVLGDLVSDQTTEVRYGIVTALIDATHATVTYIGQLQGPQGIQGEPGYSWRTTATPIADTGTTDVVLVPDSDHPISLNDLVVDQSAAAHYGIITALIDSTHATVAHIGQLQGPQGIQGVPGDPGVVQSIVAGAGASVDSTDPANPVISVVGSGGVDSVVAGTAIAVDSTDPANPIVGVDQETLIPIFTDALPTASSWTGQFVYAQGIPAVDDGPYYSDGSTWTAVTGGGGGGVASVVAGANVAVDDTDPANPIVSVDTSSGGLVGTIGFQEAPYNVDTELRNVGTAADQILELNLIKTDNGSGFVSEVGGPATNLRMMSDNTAWKNLIQFAANSITISSTWDSNDAGGSIEITPGSSDTDPGSIVLSGILNLSVLSADPAGTFVDGAIYYNSTTHAIRLYYSGAWH